MSKSEGQGEGAVTGTSETELSGEGYLTGVMTFGREASTQSNSAGRKQGKNKHSNLILFIILLYLFVCCQ